MHRYFIIYKPFGVLSQFTSEDGKQTLKDYCHVPGNVYPVGRLDYDSEGLLLLTNDTSLNKRLLHPQQKQEKEYWVQVEGTIDRTALDQLESGVTISINGKPHHTLPARATLFEKEPALPERVPPIRYRKNIPTSWISLVLHEGKNRQVRKMTAQTGYPTLRLVRYRLGQLTVGNMLPGDVRELDRQEVYRSL